MEQCSARTVKSLGLSSETIAVALVVDQDVKHRLALISEPIVELVEVAHYVNERSAPLFGLDDAPLEQTDLLAEASLASYRFLRAPLFYAYLNFRCHTNLPVADSLGLRLTQLVLERFQFLFEGDHLEFSSNHHFFELFEVQYLLLQFTL